MGDAFGEGYPEDHEGLVREVEVASILMDPTTVTNADFAEFVDATGHRTDAELYGVSAVFETAWSGPGEDVLGRAAGTPWWLSVRGADWRRPHGRWSDSSLLSDHPVVHVSWRDATAYADWAGGRLPTEAEWEHAARGGLESRRYPWGDELLTEDGGWRCNVWQGEFPQRNDAEDGHLFTAPVHSFEPNGFGLWQMVGNVWEWSADLFDPSDPSGPRTLRGGSYLCHPSYCFRYRVSARSRNTVTSTAGNIGFRCVSP
ncbi:sulfatase modifying factor 1 (C-alpha-formyglycine- generating enzyme 1) [Nocardioides sp. Soil797]|nr:sulfatase modifying factor 1 (C-alpha-formyglycine- generating enzyme 1) [Nocardioides sp. Soil797]